MYFILTLAVSFLLFPFFLLSGRGRIRLRERYGVWPGIKEPLIWFHGASVGEVKGLIPVIEKIKPRFPGTKVLLTSCTVEGLKTGEEFCDRALLLPFDNSFYVKRAIGDLDIKLFVFGETELWPGLIDSLYKKQVPMYLVNARISEYSWPYYRALKPFLSSVVRKPDLILTSTVASKERFEMLGADPVKVICAGNAKYDLMPSLKTGEERNALRRKMFGNTLPVLTLGSIRPGEERVWLPAVFGLIGDVGRYRFNLVVAPRHGDKFGYFEEALRGAGLNFIKWSAAGELDCIASEDGRIILLDTLGDLEKVYGATDLAFTGGTIADFGGHNPLEAAAYGVALAAGPHCENIREITEALGSRGALLAVNSVEEAAGAILLMLENPDALKALGRLAQQVWRNNCGAVGRITGMVSGTEMDYELTGGEAAAKRGKQGV